MRMLELRLEGSRPRRASRPVRAPDRIQRMPQALTPWHERGRIGGLPVEATPSDKERVMTLQINHVHVKTRDPKKTVQFYVENFGATVVSEVGRNGYRLNLHGLMVNVSDFVETQTREQHYGMEHLAVDTDDYPATMATLRANGVKILEELVASGGRRVGFCEGPDGTQMEIIEKAKA
jgi:lactoylglutathione lyase